MLKVIIFYSTGEAANIYKTPCFVADRTMHGVSNHAWCDPRPRRRKEVKHPYNTHGRGKLPLIGSR